MELLKEKYTITKKKLKNKVLFSLNNDVDNFVICEMDDYTSKSSITVDGLSKLIALPKINTQIGMKSVIRGDGGKRMTKKMLETELYFIKSIRNNINYYSSFKDGEINRSSYLISQYYKVGIRGDRFFKYRSLGVLRDVWYKTLNYGINVEIYNTSSLDINYLFDLGYLVYEYPSQVQITKQGIFRLWQEGVIPFSYLKDLGVI